LEEKETLILLGAGGHCLSVLSNMTQETFNLVVLDDDPSKEGTVLRDTNFLTVSGPITQKGIEAGAPPGSLVLVSLGSPLSKRKELYEWARGLGYQPLRLWLDAEIAFSSAYKIGEGTVALRGSRINASSSVGVNCIINTGAIIEHDCRVGDHVHVAPGSVLCGGVTVEEGAHIGANATVLEGLTVGAWATVGAGSVVTKDVPAGETWVGNPAIRMVANK